MSRSDTEYVFVAGALRSGTTLLRILLDQHPDISNPGEFDFLFDGVVGNADGSKASDYRQQLLNSRIFLATKLALNEFPDIYTQIEDLAAQVRQPGKLLTLNIHRNFDQALDVFPQAKFVHLLRDPRDVARSSMKMGWAGNVYYGVDHWIDTERTWGALRRKLAEGQYIEIRYESLVADPESVLKSICTYLELPFKEAMLEFPPGSTYGTPDPTLAEQWKTKLSLREIQLVEFKVGELLNDRGYITSGDQMYRPSILERMLLWFENRWGKNRYSVDRYGWPLWLREKISRHFRLRAIWVGVRRRMDEIDTKHLR